MDTSCVKCGQEGALVYRGTVSGRVICRDCYVKGLLGDFKTPIQKKSDSFFTQLEEDRRKKDLKAKAAKKRRKALADKRKNDQITDEIADKMMGDAV